MTTTTRAVIYVHGPILPNPKEHDVGRQQKLRACRAYCERMGYTVVEIITATNPHPYFGTEMWRVREQSGWEAARAYLAAQPHHPEDDADALLTAGAVDVKVVFTPVGDSGPFPWREPSGLKGHMPPPPRVEEASLWEIEPPTPKERLRVQWFNEDMERWRKRERTRAVLYVRAGAQYLGREAATQQEHYCRGYCNQHDYEVVAVFRDTAPTQAIAARAAVGNEQWPGLRDAMRAIADGQAHLLVALDESTLAEDGQALAALHEQVSRIEYARTYAAQLQLKAMADLTLQLQALFERTETEHRPDTDRRR